MIIKINSLTLFVIVATHNYANVHRMVQEIKKIATKFKLTLNLIAIYKR